MFHIKIQPRRIVLFSCMFLALSAHAQTSDRLYELEADMLKYIATNDRELFFTATDRLKQASQNEGNERLFYKAWSKEAVYEATHQDINRANEIVDALTKYAQEKNSIIGKYYSLHTRGTVLQQQDRFAEAEKVYLEALEIRHKNYPEESAAEDLRELIKIAYQTGENAKAKKYANQLLAEPNLAPHHKGRTLNRLSVIAFEENDVEEYNHIYEEMKRLSKTNGIKSLSVYAEVNYQIINGDYKHALRLADLLSADTCAERKALIYHRMGDNEKAYEYMALYKHVSDSLARVSHSNTVADLYLRMNNDRLRLERQKLSHQNSQLRYQFYIVIGIFLILVLLLLIYQRHRMVKLLQDDNQMLNYGKKGAERALKDLNELSFYESKTELPLTDMVNVNKFCNHLTTVMQRLCNEGVVMAMQTEFDDNFEVKTNSDALSKLLTHLLNYSARFTHKGHITLQCADSGEFVRFSVTDTSLGFGNRHNVVGMFADDGNTIRYVGMNFNICQSITRLLKGRIWHDVAYIEGTRFCFEIPKEP